MNDLKTFIRPYSRFLTRFPILVIILVLLITGFAMMMSQRIQMESTDYKDMLPDDVEVMESMTKIDDYFGGSNTAQIAIEIDPEYAKSNEARDVRNLKVMTYVDILSQAALHIDDVVSVSGPSLILKELNDGFLPKSKNDIISLIEDNEMRFSQYISSDYSMIVLSIRLSEDYNEDNFASDMQDLVDEIPPPAGISARPAGDIIADTIVMSYMSSDMSKTSTFSMMGILFVLLIMFGALRYSLTPLSTIIIGVMWAMGYVGLIGMNMTSQTSGVVSMIMGIGIDFGIQIVSRFRYELKNKKIEEAMTKTLNNVFIPMATTTLAALIGFSAMSMGQLTMLADMGTMMAYGVTACFLVAITFIPALLVLLERFYNFRKKLFKNVFRRKKK